MASIPLFIVFEGIDGSGTSTQCQILCDRLRSEGHVIVQSREPGGTAAGERIRALVLDPELTDLDDMTELLLYGASRRQHVWELIEPALADGKPVISDRYTGSSYAYQGGGRGLAQDTVTIINDLATGGRRPDITIYLDLPMTEAGRRRRARGADADRIEAAGDALQERVGRSYRELAQQNPKNSLVLDSSPGVDVVAELIRTELDARFPKFPFR